MINIFKFAGVFLFFTPTPDRLSTNKTKLLKKKTPFRINTHKTTMKTTSSALYAIRVNQQNTVANTYTSCSEAIKYPMQNTRSNWDTEDGIFQVIKNYFAIQFSGKSDIFKRRSPTLKENAKCFLPHIKNGTVEIEYKSNLCGFCFIASGKKTLVLKLLNSYD